MKERRGTCSSYGREVDTADGDGYSPGHDTFADCETNGVLSKYLIMSKKWAPCDRDHATVSTYCKDPMSG